MAFYYFALIVTVASIWLMARLVASPFGAGLRGTRDQARRMAALGHNVWRVRWLTFVYAGFWGAVSGLLYVYYHKYIHPTSLSLTSSAEALLGVIAGGAGTLAGPIVGVGVVLILKNYASAYIERWNMLLGFVFLVIILFMPDGLVPGVRRAWARLRGQGDARARDRRSLQVLRRAAGDQPRHAERPARRTPPDHRAERRGQDDALQPDHRRFPAGLGEGAPVRARHHAARAPPARAPRRRAHVPDHHAVPEGHARAQRRTRAARLETIALERLPAAHRRYRAHERARRALALVHLEPLAKRTIAEISYGEKRRVEIALALAQRPKLLLLDEPLAGLSRDERAAVKQLIDSIPRETTVVLIEHDMDTALDLAERITVLHYGSVIVEGTRAEVVADPKTREVYLGH
jgi:ABC-type sugar transport system ATPase subunit